MRSYSVRWWLRPLFAAMLTAVLCTLARQSAAAEFDASTELASLAEGARVRMTERIEEPAAQLPFLCLARRSEGAPMREYVLRQQAQAIEMLLASVSSPADAEQVRRLLEELGRDGYSRRAAARLADTAPGGTTGLRLAAALGELPAALHARMRAGCSAGSYLGLLGRTDRPLGDLAGTDFQRLTEIEPEDPWHWLVLAWLAGEQGEPALQRSLSTVQASATPEALRVQVFVWQQMAWLHLELGRGDDAQAAAMEAMRLAQEALRQIGTDAASPAAEQLLRDVAQTGSVLSIVFEDIGQKTAALEVLSQLMPLQQRLTELRPDDLPAQYALIEMLARMGTLQGISPPPAAAGGAPAKPLQQAVALYKQLQQRTPYSPMLARSGWPGMFLTAAGGAGVLTLLLGWTLLGRYRRKVGRLMLSAANLRYAAVDADPQAVAPPGPPADTSAAAGTLRRAAVVQVVAGLAFGVLAAWLQLRADGTEPNFNRMAIISWTWAWPTVLALAVIWDGDRRRKRLAWAAYLGGLLLICTRIAIGETPSLQMFGTSVPAFLQGLVFWALALSYSPLLLLFLNRSVRSIGPALLVMMLVAMAGGMLAMVAASTPAGMDMMVELLQVLHLPAGWVLPVVMLGGMLAAAPIAWWVGRRLRAAYAAKWLSDQSLMIDTLWLFQATVLSFELSWAFGPYGWLGMGVFGLHKAITLAGMWPAARTARRRRPLRLLLLRVFKRRDAQGRVVSRRADAERLFDLLGSRWRYAGPIAMIGAPDLAGSTIDPDEFLDFLAGRLRNRFILEPADVPARLAALDERCDFDARWRVSEIFCGNDAWCQAVQALMTRSDLVVMDLRDFGPDNQGCLFELQALLDLVPVARVALLVDRSTHLDFLNATIEACIGRLAAGSPNDRSGGRMNQVNIDGGEQGAVDHLLRMAAQVA